jgi:hypothetical protein
VWGARPPQDTTQSVGSEGVPAEQVAATDETGCPYWDTRLP